MEEEQTILLMSALIAAVRTARFEGKDFQGMSTPRMMGAVSNSLWLAEAICKYRKQQLEGRKFQAESSA